MAVTFGGSQAGSLNNGTATSFTSGNFTIAGANRVIIVYVGLADATATVSSITWSLGSSTAVLVKAFRQSDAYMAVWAIPAPTTGTGTYTVNFSASTQFQVAADYFNGADQTTPCVTADSAAQGYDSGTAAQSNTQTPSSLTANDASAGGLSLTVAGGENAVTPHQTYSDSGTNVNMECGYNTGTTGVTYIADGAGHASIVTVRVIAVGSTSGLPPGLGPSLEMDPATQSAQASMMR